MADSTYPTVVTTEAQATDNVNQANQFLAGIGDPVAQHLAGVADQFLGSLGDPVDIARNAINSARTDAQHAIGNAQTTVQATVQGAANAARPAAGDIAGWRRVIQSQLPQNLQNDTGLVNTILAGGYAESGLDPNRVQQGGGGRGFFQFDLGGMGQGLSNNQLFSEAYQASQIIPQYVHYWQQAPANLSPAEKASWVAAMAERPYDYTNPASTARRNYANAYNVVSGGDNMAPAAPSPYQGTSGVAANEGANRSAGSPSTGSGNLLQQGQDFIDSLGSPIDNAIQGAKQTGQNLLSGATSTIDSIGPSVSNALDQAGQAYTNEADKLNATVNPSYDPQAEQQREQQPGYQGMLDFQTQNLGNFPDWLRNGVASPFLGSLYGGIEAAGQKLTGGAPRPFEQNLPSDPAQAALVLGQRYAQGQDVSQLPAQQQGFAGVAHTAADLLNPVYLHAPVPSLSVQPVAGWLNEVLAPAQNTAPEVQTALRDLAGRRLQATVDAETLAMQAKRILGANDNAAAASQFERTGEFVPNPTPEQAAFAQRVRQFMQDSGNLGRQRGYIGGDVTQAANGPANYFPHLYEDSASTSGTSLAGQGRNLNPRDFYSNARSFPTLDAATQAGYQPVDSVGAPLRAYAQHVGESEAKAQFLEDLQNANPNSVMPYRPGDQLPPGWVPGDRIDRQFAPRPVSIVDQNGNPQTVYTNGTAFAPDVAKALTNVLSPSGIRGTALGRAALQAMSAGKETLFSLSGFHLLTELRQSIRANGVQGVPVVAKAVQAAISPNAWETFRVANADAFSQAARAGVTGLGEAIGPDLGMKAGAGLGAQVARSAVGGLASGASVYATAKAAGEDEASARQKALIAAGVGALAGPTLGKAINDSLWERAVPTMKVLTFQLARQSGASPEAAAAFSNNTFGGQNLAAIARSPNVQEAIRFVALAPDWWESWANQAAGLVRGGDLGALSRGYWLRTALVDGAFLLEGLNYALNGHLTTQNDPGHQLDLELTGLYDRLGWAHRDAKGVPYRPYLDVLGPIKALMQAPTDPGHFAQTRLGLVPSIAAEAITNRDYRGQPIAQPGEPWPVGAVKQAGNALARIAPVGGQQIDQSLHGGEPLPVTIGSSVTGLRTSRGGNSFTPLPSILPSSTDDLLRQDGVTAKVGPVGQAIRGIKLTTSERDRYQQLAAQYADQGYRDLRASKEWTGYTPTERTKAAENVFRVARQRAADQVFESIPVDEIKRRESVGGK